MIKVDMHVHTSHSKDGLLSPEQIVLRCQEKGLGSLAITDHNSISGALAVRDLAPFPIIVGQEISTSQGEVMGLFLEHQVSRDLSPSDTIASIKAQGGLAGVPHPFDKLRGETLEEQALMEIADQLDFIEGFNCRVTFGRSNRRAQEFARSRGLLCTAGSDAHSSYELGRAYVEMASFSGKEEFLENLANGSIVGSASPYWVHLFSVYARLRRLAKG